MVAQRCRIASISNRSHKYTMSYSFDFITSARCDIDQTAGMTFRGFLLVVASLATSFAAQVTLYEVTYPPSTSPSPPTTTPNYRRSPGTHDVPMTASVALQANSGTDPPRLTKKPLEIIYSDRIYTTVPPWLCAVADIESWSGPCMGCRRTPYGSKRKLDSERLMPQSTCSLLL
jgi:hypothetical protein